MKSKNLVALSTTLVVLAMLVAPSASAVTYTITVKTDASSYFGTETLTASGTVSPPPTPGTAAFLEILFPSGGLAAVASASVSAVNGSYQHRFVLGGSSNWVKGTYTVNASWGDPATSHVILTTTSFTYSPSAPSTSTTTNTTSTTTSASTTSSTTTSTTTSQTSTTTSSSTSSTTSTTSTSSTTSTVTPTVTITSSSSSSTTSTSTSGGGIPEFPFSMLAAAVFTFLLVASYLLVRRHRTSVGPAGRSPTGALSRGIREVG